MDFYEYITNKGVEPYRLMRGIRNIVDFDPNYNSDYSPHKKVHLNDIPGKQFLDVLFNTALMDEESNSGKVSKLGIFKDDYTQIVKFFSAVKSIFYHNAALKEDLKLRSIDLNEVSSLKRELTKAKNKIIILETELKVVNDYIKDCVNEVNRQKANNES